MQHSRTVSTIIEEKQQISKDHSNFGFNSWKQKCNTVHLTKNEIHCFSSNSKGATVRVHTWY